VAGIIIKLLEGDRATRMDLAHIDKLRIGHGAHAGEEVGYVVAGYLELTVDGRAYLLGAGGSFFFNSSLPHSYRNIGTSEARVVWMNSHRSRLR